MIVNQPNTRQRFGLEIIAVYIKYKAIVIDWVLFLCGTDTEHARSTGWANTLAGRFTIFHSNSLGAFHFFLRAALHTICFHVITSIIQ
jgi:hypothetical protein